MDIDGLFINSILSSQSREEIRSSFSKVPMELVQGMERMMYKFIREYYKQSRGQLPSAIAMKKKFPEFRRIKPGDSIHFYVGELQSRQIYELSTDYNTKIQNALLIKDIEEMKGLHRAWGMELAKINMIEADTARTNFIDRKREYRKAKLNKGLIGLQTGIEAIDKHIGGLQDEMYIIMGRRGVGKTFMSLFMLKNIWKQLDGTAMYVSNEIGKKKILKRVDSIEAEFSYSKYRKGLLTKEEEQRLNELKDIYKNRPELYVIPGARKTVEDIENELLVVEPKIIFVDGLYLTDMGHDDPFRNTFEASRSYQQMLSAYQIPGIFTTQMTDDNSTKYARAIEEDADIVMKMSQNSALKDDKLMKLEFPKIREEDSDLIAYMNWDFDKWNFTEANPEDIDEGAEQEFD